MSDFESHRDKRGGNLKSVLAHRAHGNGFYRMSVFRGKAALADRLSSPSICEYAFKYRLLNLEPSFASTPIIRNNTHTLGATPYFTSS